MNGSTATSTAPPDTTATPAPRDGNATDPRPLDVRLLPGAVAAWLAVAALLRCGPVILLAIAATAFAAGTALMLVRRLRHWSPAAALALAAWCVALVLIPLAGRVLHARASPLNALANRGAAVTVSFTVHDDPRQLTGRTGVPMVLLSGDAESVRLGASQTRVDGRVTVFATDQRWQRLVPGQRVSAEARLAPNRNGDALSVTAFARGSPMLSGAPPWWQRAATAVRSDLRRACRDLPQPVRGLLPGLIDGDTSDLDPVLAQRFQVAGLTHLVAVSGLTAQ